MLRYFLDSSALAKAYHAEAGTPKIVALLNEPGSEFIISSLTVIEMQSVFSKRVRDGTIADSDYLIVRRRFSADIRRRLLAVKNLLRSHQRTAEKLLEVHARSRSLRTLDAIQLGAAIELNKRLSLDYFVCADKSLVEVARLEGMPVLNPEEP
jgi:predicted nucleic acid-binding protein